MREPCRELDLLKEPLRAERTGDLGAQHLHRHSAMVLAILREEDYGRAALAELALYGVTVS